MGKADSAFSRGAKLEDTTIGWRFINPLMKARYGVDSMPETAENVAEQFGVARKDQDLFALRSQQRWARASAAGFFDGEIAAVAIPQRKGEPLWFGADEQAFAAQGLAVTRDLGLADDAEQVNPNGGAIAIGHPLGASGARLVTTALNQLERMKGRYGLCTMCIGVGQGIALVIERL